MREPRKKPQNKLPKATPCAGCGKEAVDKPAAARPCCDKGWDAGHKNPKGGCGCS